ncbi:MAG: hypothetical protein ABIL70_05270 [candidate division WOR-3 bacterium]
MAQVKGNSLLDLNHSYFFYKYKGVHYVQFIRMWNQYSQSSYRDYIFNPGVEGQINPEDVYREVIAKFKEGVIVIPEGKSGGTLEEITINVPVIKGVGTGVLSQN